MSRMGRIAWIAGSAVATLLLAVAAPLWPGRGAVAVAQYAQPAPGTPAAAATGTAPQAVKPAAPGVSAPFPAPSQPLGPAAESGAGTTAAEGPLMSGKIKLPQIKGEYDIDELRRLIDLARESGFSEEQVRDITVEDESGNSIRAYEFLQAYDRRQKEEAARIAAVQKKVYLSPKDVMKELDQKQPQDLNQLRDKMVFTD